MFNIQTLPLYTEFRWVIF